MSSTFNCSRIELQLPFSFSATGATESLLSDLSGLQAAVQSLPDEVRAEDQGRVWRKTDEAGRVSGRPLLRVLSAEC